MKEKVILAYSGGLDTTAIIPWLKENYDYDVICVCANVGQGNELDGLEERAKLSGASKLYIEDLVDEFVDDYVIPTVQANAVYENKYLLGTSFGKTCNRQKTGRDCTQRKTLLPSVMVPLEKATIRCASSLPSKHWLQILKLSLHGDATIPGRCSHAKMRSLTARSMASISHFPLTAATAVTAICGISAMRVWNWKTQQMNQTMTIC